MFISVISADNKHKTEMKWRSHSKYKHTAERSLSFSQPRLYIEYANSVLRTSLEFCGSSLPFGHSFTMYAISSENSPSDTARTFTTRLKSLSAGVIHTHRRPDNLLIFIAVLTNKVCREIYLDGFTSYRRRTLTHYGLTLLVADCYSPSFGPLWHKKENTIWWSAAQTIYKASCNGCLEAKCNRAAEFHLFRKLGNHYVVLPEYFLKCRG